MDRLTSRTLADLNQVQYYNVPLPDQTIITPGYEDEDSNSDPEAVLFDLTPDFMIDEIAREYESERNEH